MNWLRIAVSIVFLFDALAWSIGFGIPLAYGLRHKTSPYWGQIKLLGGPFEALGMDALIVAGLLFIVVSMLKVMAGYWLWRGRMDGAVLGLVLMALSNIFYYGFELPLGPPMSIVEIVLVVLVWKTLI